MAQQHTITHDVGELLEQGRISPLQAFATLFAAIAIVLDGFDGQLIGFAIPSILKEFAVTRNQFAPIVAIGLIGMGLGSLTAGLFGDRLGRRAAIVGSVLTFGAATALIGAAHQLWHIGLLRFIAGFGIGGALPSASVVVAELTPRRFRTVAVTATILCVPLGGMLAGLFASAILPDHGWRLYFAAGGLIAAVFSLVLAGVLPESPRWQATRPSHWPKLIRFLRRIGRDVADDASFVDEPGEPANARALGEIFKNGLAPSTLALFFGFFLTLFAVYSVFSWLPTLLTSLGWSSREASQGLTLYNLGGVFGALLCAFAINRFGSRLPLAACCGLAGLAALAGVMLDGRQQHAQLLFAIAANGFFVNAVQSTLYAVTANLYPTRIRATGSASALSVGRLGAILSALTGAAMITQWGAAGYFGALVVAALGALIALGLLPRHIARAAHSA